MQVKWKAEGQTFVTENYEKNVNLVASTMSYEQGKLQNLVNLSETN